MDYTLTYLNVPEEEREDAKLLWEDKWIAYLEENWYILVLEGGSLKLGIIMSLHPNIRERLRIASSMEVDNFVSAHHELTGYDIDVYKRYHAVKYNLLVGNYDLAIDYIHRTRSGSTFEWAIKYIIQADDPEMLWRFHQEPSYRKVSDAFWFLYLPVALRRGKKNILNFLLSDPRAAIGCPIGKHGVRMAVARAIYAAAIVFNHPHLYDLIAHIPRFYKKFCDVTVEGRGRLEYGVGIASGIKIIHAKSHVELKIHISIRDAAGSGFYPLRDHVRNGRAFIVDYILSYPFHLDQVPVFRICEKLARLYGYDNIAGMFTAKIKELNERDSVLIASWTDPQLPCADPDDIWS